MGSEPKLQWVPTVVRDKHGKEYDAWTASCECGCVSFFLISTEEERHIHIQCPNCNATYCSDSQHHPGNERPN